MPTFAVGLPLQTASPLRSLLIIHGLPDGFAMDDPRAATHLSRRAHLDLVNTVTIDRIVIAWLFIHASTAVHRSPAYLFATGSAPMPPDGGASWEDYILRHPSRRFTSYALPLGPLLHGPFAVGFPLQTDSPLRSPLIIHGLPGGFTMDDSPAATHLSRRRPFILKLLKCLKYQSKLLLLTESNGKHRGETTDAMSFAL